MNWNSYYSSGIITSGGTASSELALLIARNQFIKEKFDIKIMEEGFVNDARTRKLQIYVTENKGANSICDTTIEGDWIVAGCVGVPQKERVVVQFNLNYYARRRSEDYKVKRKKPAVGFGRISEEDV